MAISTASTMMIMQTAFISYSDAATSTDKHHWYKKTMGYRNQPNGSAVPQKPTDIEFKPVPPNSRRPGSMPCRLFRI